MTNRRAMFISFAVGLLAILLLLTYMRRFERDMSGGERIRLLVAVKPLKRGALITDEIVSSREVPIAYVEQRAIKASERAKVVGVRAAANVPAEGVIMWTDLAISSEDRDLSSLVQAGRRAMTVRAASAEEEKSNALIRPGDYIDVLATMSAPNAENETEATKSVVLLQRVLVLAIGLDTEPQAMNAAQNNRQRSSQRRDMILTLSLTLQESQLLSLASERGRLAVALRNPEDPRIAEGLPDMAVGDLFNPVAREQIQTVRRTARAPVLEPGPEGPVKLEGVKR